MEVLECTKVRDVGGEFMQSGLNLRVGDQPQLGEARNCAGQGQTGGLIVDLMPERPQGEGIEQGHVGPVQVFEEQAASVMVPEAARCQVKITTRRNIHLRIANHTATDVYVRLVGHGGRIARTRPDHHRGSLEKSVLALKDPVPLSPLEPSVATVDAEQPSLERGNSALINDLQPHCASLETSNLPLLTPKAEDEVEEDDEGGGALTISELAYSPCASMLPTPVEDGQGGVSQLFSSPVQSPARLLRELHADPDIQAQLEADRERDRAFECARLAARSRMSGVVATSLRLLSSNERVNTWVRGVARFVAVLIGVLLITVPTLLLLLESDIDVSFLHEIRQTPEFEQFHYEYYCPLRRWILCKMSTAMENMWSD